jgi:anti-anti-sigma regulatory factor
LAAPLLIAPSGPCRFTLRGDLTEATAATLEDRLDSLPPETSVVLDLSRVTAIDTAGLGAITRVAERLDAVVILEGPSEDVALFLEATSESWGSWAVIRPRRARGLRSEPTRRHAKGPSRRDPMLDWS